MKPKVGNECSNFEIDSLLPCVAASERRRKDCSCVMMMMMMMMMS
jgi:hypothetical protein